MTDEAKLGLVAGILAVVAVACFAYPTPPQAATATPIPTAVPTGEPLTPIAAVTVSSQK